MTTRLPFISRFHRDGSCVGVIEFSPSPSSLEHLGPTVREVSRLSKTAPCIPQTRLLLFPHILDGGLQSICCYMKKNVAAAAELPPRFQIMHHCS